MKLYSVILEQRTGTTFGLNIRYISVLGIGVSIF